ncbi:mitogen-activated protein kinase kinase kinase 1-like [Eucalyptus grandis]|uniref:mitogen-activated protein kinase kinase kinase 1-like n=1 Tax=Eucalyptus grandis TaxID=71139 RepID=UPI00192EF0E9|nr:mitogen-activated protein kinase kinase kinase 1-like [Eucalyptus grandis]
MASPPSSMIICICPSIELNWSDGDDSFLSTVEDKESKDKKALGNTPLAGNLEPWRPVSSQGCFKRNIALWRKCRLLGKGSYADVYEVMTDDGSFFAVKEVPLLDQGSQGNQSLSQLEQEIKLYRQFEHENIVQYIGTDKDNKKLYVFLELMSKGSLSTLYHKRPLTESQVSAYTRQILEGLKYLHDQKVMHRDIKCANILVDASGSVKLTGFGLAEATEMSAARSLEGTFHWMAPEVVKSGKNGSYELKADIWSLGCTVLEMLTCKPPYSDSERAQVLYKIQKGELPRVPKFLSEDARDFIRECLQANPNERPSAAQLLDHPFVMKPPPSGFAQPRYKNKLS